MLLANYIQPLKEVRTAEDAEEQVRAILDENGNVVGYEYFRNIYNEAGEKIGEEKIDKEAQAKKREAEAEEAEKKEVEELKTADEFDIDFEWDSAGMSEKDIEVEKITQEQEKKEREDEMMKKYQEIMTISDEKQRKEAMDKLLGATVETSSIPN